MKRTPVILGVLLLAYLLMPIVRKCEPVPARSSDHMAAPSFDIRVVKPRSARPLAGFLPPALLGLEPNEFRFDPTSRGADVVYVGSTGVHFRAVDWELRVEIDAEGRIDPSTRLVFPVELANRERRLRCRPVERGDGYLRTTRWPGQDLLSGSFRVEFDFCENVLTGKKIEWPPAALKVIGSFDRLPRSERMSAPSSL